MTTTPRQVHGIDGLVYSPEMEDRLNRLVAATFAGETGRKCLEYLRNVTVNRVHGPEVSDSTLRHAEGSRFIVAIIERRIAAARDSSQ